MEKSIFTAFRQTVAERNLGVYGVHLYQEGAGEAEHRFRADDDVALYSASKTFTAVGVGICQAEGGLKLEDKVLDYFPEFKAAAAEGSGDITLKNLLNMAGGKHVPWAAREQERSMDLAEAFFREPQTAKPGAIFYYANLCTYMLGRVVERVSGQTLRDYLVPRLFTPLDIFNPQWHACAGGHTYGAFGLCLTTKELARLGRLLLQEGEWDGRQLVPADYVRAMHTDVVSSSHHDNGDAESQAGYGYQVWRCTRPGTYRADGMYGQFSIVMPDKKAVVTLTSHNEVRPNDIIRAVFADIEPLL